MRRFFVPVLFVLGVSLTVNLYPVNHSAPPGATEPMNPSSLPDRLIQLERSSNEVRRREKSKRQQLADAESRTATMFRTIELKQEERDRSKRLIKRLGQLLRQGDEEYRLGGRRYTNDSLRDRLVGLVNAFDATENSLDALKRLSESHSDVVFRLRIEVRHLEKVRAHARERLDLFNTAMQQLQSLSTEDSGLGDAAILESIGRLSDGLEADLVAALRAKAVSVSLPLDLEFRSPEDIEHEIATRFGSQ